MLVRQRSMRRLAIPLLLAMLAAGCDGLRSGEQPRVSGEQRSLEEPVTAPSSPEAPEARRTGAVEKAGSDKVPGRTYVAWTPGGLPPGTIPALAEIPGVTGAAEVTAGLIWMTDATSGVSPAEGYGIPIEVAFVERRAHRQMFPSAPRYLHFSPGNLLFSGTGFALRRVARGIYALDSDRGSFRGRCCTSDRAAMGYEAISAGAPPDDWGVSYALVRATRALSARDVRRSVGQGPWRVRSRDDTPYLRYADAVVPQMRLKEHFGEFSARPSDDGTLTIEPTWLERNIVQRKVPILGKVECHRSLFEQLQLALGTLDQRGLAAAVKPSEYAGCFNARFIGSDPGGRLSSHAWGAALDTASASNPFGAPPSMDPRVVRVLERAGFNWGGRWLVPDGMHFEWARSLGS